MRRSSEGLPKCAQKLMGDTAMRTIVHPSNGANMVGAPKKGESVECAETRNSAVCSNTRTVTREKTGAVVVEHCSSGPARRRCAR
jgi:hypothetical protein